MFPGGTCDKMDVASADQEKKQQMFNKQQLMRKGLNLLFLLLQLLSLCIKTVMTEAAVQKDASFLAKKGILGQRTAPVIGVLMQPVADKFSSKLDGVVGQRFEVEGTSYIASSYVKYIEAAGCVALPIDLDWGEEHHKAIFDQIDALLLPGGSADIGSWEAPYVKTAKLYYQLAEESNKRGLFFPIFAICLGFEVLLIIASGNLNYFKVLHDDNIDRRRLLTFHSDADNSVMFGCASLPAHERRPELAGEVEEEGAESNDEERQMVLQDGVSDLAALRSVFSVPSVRSLLTAHPIAYFHHFRHLSVEEFSSDQVLSSEWNLNATTRLPREGFKEIVAAVEHKKFPFYGLQFHPEKALYEHCPEYRIPHFFSSTLPSLYIAAFMGLLARRSHNVFEDKKEEFFEVAFAFTPTRTAQFGKQYKFEQVYFFPQAKRRELKRRVEKLMRQKQRQQYMMTDAASEEA